MTISGLSVDSISLGTSKGHRCFFKETLCHGCGAFLSTDSDITSHKYKYDNFFNKFAFQH